MDEKVVTIKLHEPCNVQEYSTFDVGIHSNYFNQEEIKHKINNNTNYLQINKMLLKLLNNNTNIHINLSISGITLDQLKEHAPEAIKSLQKLAKTKRVEFLGQTYYYSNAAKYSKKEFKEQVQKHKELISQLFGCTPTIFHDTTNTINKNAIEVLSSMGYKAILEENEDIPHNIATLTEAKKIPIIIQNKNNTCNINQNNDTIPQNTTHISAQYDEISTNILNLQLKNTATKALTNFIETQDTNNIPSINFNNTTQKNEIQEASIEELYKIEDQIKQTKDDSIIRDWKTLTSTNHIQQMDTTNLENCNIFENSPFEKHLSFMNILEDIKHRSQ